MSLLTLPSEITSRICRFLGLRLSPGSDPIRYENTDFQSFRMTCRTLYNRTAFDAGVRYEHLLENLQMDLTYLPLCQLLHISGIPEFRDRIKQIIFSASTIEEAIPTAPWLDSALAAMKKEEAKSYLQSSEAVYLLSECLHRLKQANSLTTIQFNSSSGYDLAILALSYARFPRRVAIFRVEPNQILTHEYRAFVQSPAIVSLYLNGLVVAAPSSNLFWEEGIWGQKLEQTKSRDNTGYRSEDHNSVHPKFTEFLSTLNLIEHLTIYGAHIHLRLHFCDGCHDTFSRNIVNIHYPSLTDLRIFGMYNSGSLLQRFVKYHTATLVNVEFDMVSLTDGSWKSIAQGLLKLPKLNSLCLGSSFYQTEPSSQLSTSPPFPLIDTMDGDYTLKGCINIQRFLSALIEHFQTQVVDVFDDQEPQWHEMVLFQFSGVAGEIGRSNPYEALQRYAKDVLE